MYAWTHDTCTKILGWKTWNNSPPMYTLIMNFLLMAQTSPMTYLLISTRVYLLLVINLIINNIIIVKSYDLSTYLFIFY